MKKFKLFTALTVLAIFALNEIAVAQIASFMGFSGMYNGVKNDRTRMFIDGLHTIRPNPGLPYKVNGKPYVAENWVSGKIEFSNKPPLDVEKLNFDALDNMLLMLKDEVEYEFTDALKSFVLFDGGKERLFWNMPDGIYEVLYEGGISYLKKNKKEMLVESKYGEQYGEGKIVDDSSYFVLDSKFDLIKINKPTAIFDVFPSNKDALKDFAKKEKLNLKKENDVVKLFEHYKSL